MLFVALLITLVAAADAAAQTSDADQPEVVTLARGASELLPLANPLTRVALADSSTANVVVLSPREILINGVSLGTTSLIVWDTANAVRTYKIEVTVDAAALQRQFTTIFPGESIQATAMGNLVVLSGTVSNGEVARRMVEIARATGGTVIENFQCVRPSTTC